MSKCVSFILAYKSGRTTYRLETHTVMTLLKSANQEQDKQRSMNSSRSTSNNEEMKPINDLSIDGQLAAICVSHDRLVFAYRRFPRGKESNMRLRDLFYVEHYFASYSASLTKLTDDIRLPSWIRWLTAIVSYGMESKYLLCDPRGQQLLLYQAIDGILIRRFHIGPVNACCLSDGRLVLWVQKAYATSPIGKLHFISPRYLRNSSAVSMSFELLKKSCK